MDPVSDQKLVKLERAVDALKVLAKTSVTTAALAKTQAGKRIRTLAKHPESKIAEAASKVISTWKDLVRRQSVGGSQATGSAPPSAADPLLASTAVAEDTTTAPQPRQKPADSIATATAVPAAIDPSQIPSTNDTVRDKIRLNLVTALQKALEEGAETESNAIDLGVSIELAILEANDNSVNAAYKNKFRQLHFNLKDDKNPDLRRRVVEGVISPSELVNLTPEELASDAKREENERIREKKLFDAAPSSVKQATTDQFQCAKCKQRKCTYYQMQTRSADEPMTNFVTCTNCGNRWKFC